MRQQNGFTLVELVVILVLLGGIAVTVVPRFWGEKSTVRESTIIHLKGAFHSAVELFHTRWLIDGEPDPNALIGRVGDWGYTINDLYFNKYGYPRLIDNVQECEDILENLLPNSILTREDYKSSVLKSDGLDGKKCTYEFIAAPYNLTYSETIGLVSLSKRN